MLATDAYALLAGDAISVLIDVRTKAEWAYIGTPDIQTLGKTPLFMEWQNYPSMEVNGQFVGAPRSAIEVRRGLNAALPLVFLCRSGARSRQAAIAMTSRRGGDPAITSQMVSKVRWTVRAAGAALAVGRQAVCPGRRLKAGRARPVSRCRPFFFAVFALEPRPWKCMTNPIRISPAKPAAGLRRWPMRGGAAAIGCALKSETISSIAGLAASPSNRFRLVRPACQFRPVS